MCVCGILFFLEQKTAYEMRISDWSSDVCSSDLTAGGRPTRAIAAPCVPARICFLPVVCILLVLLLQRVSRILPQKASSVGVTAAQSAVDQIGTPARQVALT